MLLFYFSLFDSILSLAKSIYSVFYFSSSDVAMLEKTK